MRDELRFYLRLRLRLLLLLLLLFSFLCLEKPSNVGTLRTCVSAAETFDPLETHYGLVIDVELELGIYLLALGAVLYAEPLVVILMARRIDSDTCLAGYSYKGRVARMGLKYS